MNVCSDFPTPGSIAAWVRGTDAEPAPIVVDLAALYPITDWTDPAAIRRAIAGQQDELTHATQAQTDVRRDRTASYGDAADANECADHARAALTALRRALARAEGTTPTEQAAA